MTGEEFIFLNRHALLGSGTKPAQPAADKEKYVNMMRESRISLTSDGIYDKRMMSVLRKVRCQVEPSNAECAQKLE